MQIHLFGMISRMIICILYSISDSLSTPWFANIVNYLVASVFPPLASKAQKDKIKSDAKHFIWDDPYLW